MYISAAGACGADAGRLPTLISWKASNSLDCDSVSCHPR